MNILTQTFMYTRKSLLVLLASSTLLAGCMMWSSWEPDFGFRDMPYAHGQKTERIGRSRQCLGCVNGRTGESAFSAQGRPVYDAKIAEDAFALVRKWPDPRWEMIGKGYDGSDWWFAPIRIFTPSIRPLILVTIPWSYQDAPRAGVGMMAISRFMKAHQDGNGYKTTWARGMMNYVEIRSSLPQEASTVRVISQNAAVTVDMPADRARSKSIVFDGQKISFERTESGTIQIGFPKK